MGYANRVNSRTTGSALVVSLILTASIGLVLAGMARFVQSSLRITSNTEDATLAFAAAEAGIEDGLLRWRYNRDVELPRLVDVEMQKSVTRANRVNLTTGEVDPLAELGQGISSSSTDSRYDLRIWYKAPAVGISSPEIPRDASYAYQLAKDKMLDVDVSGLRGQTLVFSYALPDPNLRATVEARLIREDSNGTLVEVKRVETAVTNGSVTLEIPAGSDNLGYRVRYKAFILTGDGAPAADDSRIHYALSLPAAAAERATGLIDTGSTIIESTGYYGGAKRTLVAKIDRTSGTVLGIFDYVLFANQDIEG